MLTSQLGISEGQAQSGAGLLFKLAKEKLDTHEFSQVENAIPEIGDLISAAPEAGGVAGALGGILTSFGGNANQLGDLARLAGGFKDLGLNADLVGKFIPIILAFVQSRGGDTIKNILEGALK